MQYKILINILQTNFNYTILKYPNRNVFELRLYLSKHEVTKPTNSFIKLRFLEYILVSENVSKSKSTTLRNELTI